MSLITHRPAKWSAVGGVLRNPIQYVITHSLPFIVASLHQADGTKIVDIRQRTRGGSVTIDVAGYVKKLVLSRLEYLTNQITNRDANAFAGFYLKYTADDEAGTLISDEGYTRFAVNAALTSVSGDMSAYVVKRSGGYVEVSRRCQPGVGGNTGYQIITLADENGSTIEVISETQNLDACPLEVLTYYSAAISRESTYTRNNCGTGYIGGKWTVNVAAGAYTSTDSQLAADALAEAAATALDTQANANVNGACTLPTYYLVKGSESIVLGRVNFLITPYLDPAHTMVATLPAPLTVYYSKSNGGTVQQKSIVIPAGGSFGSYVNVNEDTGYTYALVPASGYEI